MAAKPKKKRNRTNKIGVGAGSALAPAAPTPPPRAAAAPMPSPEDTRSKATEAAQRAEVFLQEKMAQQKEDPSAAATATSSGSPPAVQRVPSLDREDEEVAAALAAAEEAHKLEASKPPRSHFNLGGLFRGSGSSGSAPSATNQRTISSSSVHSQKSTDSGRAKAAAAKSESQAAPEETQVQRLQREQEEAQRAMAERELQMRKEQKEKEARVESKPLEIPSYGEAKESEPTVLLEISSYGESKPIESIPVPAPPPKHEGPKLSMVSNFSFMAPKPVEPVKKKPLPVAKDTATDAFVAMMRMFSNKVSFSMTEIQRLRQHKSGLLQERFKTAAKQRLAIQQKAVAEAQQMEAAEAEDFELADRLTTLLEGHERDETECASILAEIGRALEQLESQKKGLVDRITGHFSEIQKKLHKFQQEQESKETEDVTEILNKFSVVSKQLSVENERLQQDWKHLERDAKLVEQERSELEKAISEQAGQYEKLRDDSRARVKTLENEMEELRKQLAAKQTQVAKLRTDAAGYDEEVLKVRIKFSRQLGRVQKKEMTIQDNREEWENEKRTFEIQKDEHESEVEAHSAALLARDKLLATLKTEVEMADTFEAIIGKEVGFEVSGNEDGPDDELTALQATVVTCEASLTEGKELLQAAAGALASLEAEAKSLEARIPMLEEMKKSAAAKRDFKSAGKASKEIKEATGRLQECKSEIAGPATERKQAAEAECQQLEKELLLKREVALEKERDASRATMRRLADHMKRLVATKASVCANASEDSIQGVGALVLDAQIEALQFEGKTYGEKYGGWDELVADLGGSKAVDGTPTPSPEDAVEEGEPRAAEEEQNHGEPSQVEPTMSGEDKAAAIAKARVLAQKIEALDTAITTASEEEDFEKAGELQEELDGLLAQISSLGLSEADYLAALEPETTDAPPNDESSPSSPTDPDTPLETPPESCAVEPDTPAEEETPPENEDAHETEETEQPAANGVVETENGDAGTAEADEESKEKGTVGESTQQNGGPPETEVEEKHAAVNGDAEEKVGPAVSEDDDDL